MTVFVIKMKSLVSLNTFLIKFSGGEVLHSHSYFMYVFICLNTVC